MSPSKPRTNRPAPIPAVLRTAVRGQVCFPTDPGWEETRASWNLPAEKQPHAVVVAESIDDVKATLAYALHHGLRVAQDSEDRETGSAAFAGTILLRTSALLGEEAATTAPEGVVEPPAMLRS